MDKNNEQETSGSQLTPLQQQRYDYLYPIYHESGIEIVRNVYGKGRKSWLAFLDKMNIVLQAKPSLKEYFNALYETFEIGLVYTGGNIIGLVNEARREMGLNPYVEKIKILSEYDFNLVFILEDVYEEVELIEGEITKVFVGYKPLAKVKPE
jgi:hypothetical protein